MKKQIMLFFISILVVTQNSRAASDHYCRYFATSFILTVPAMLYLKDNNLRYMLAMPYLIGLVPCLFNKAQAAELLSDKNAAKNSGRYQMIVERFGEKNAIAILRMKAAGNEDRQIAETINQSIETGIAIEDLSI